MFQPVNFSYSEFQYEGSLDKLMNNEANIITVFWKKG